MGHIILITGGARSGKSGYAERRAGELGGGLVTYIATAEPLDAEMERRIADHRAERSAEWITVEAPRQAWQAVRAATTPTVLVECLTVLAANLCSRSKRTASRQHRRQCSRRRKRFGMRRLLARERRWW